MSRVPTEKLIVLETLGGDTEIYVTPDLTKCQVVHVDHDIEGEEGYRPTPFYPSVLSSEDARFNQQMETAFEPDPEDVLLVIPEGGEFILPVRGPGIPYMQSGSYTRNEVTELLREWKQFPEAIQFIADMLEE